MPKRVRAVYPPLAPGEGSRTRLEAMWHEDGDFFDLWLDRQQHQLYGPGLLSKIAWDRAHGDKLRIVWAPDILTIYLAGHDEQVQQEEVRHIDRAALKELRGGLGEDYRDSIQRLLSMAPGGLTWQEIWHALSQRLAHAPSHRTLLALLYEGGFVGREHPWFAASDNTVARRALRTALIATLLPRKENLEEPPLSEREQTHQQIQAIVRRLEEIELLE